MTKEDGDKRKLSFVLCGWSSAMSCGPGDAPQHRRDPECRTISDQSFLFPLSFLIFFINVCGGKACGEMEEDSKANLPCKAAVVAFLNRHSCALFCAFWEYSSASCLYLSKNSSSTPACEFGEFTSVADGYIFETRLASLEAGNFFIQRDHREISL